MIITISGHAGSGKSTIGKLLADKLGYEFYSVGNLRRELATERGMSIEEFNKLGEKDASTDKLADERTKKLGSTKTDFVLEGRLGWHFIPKSYKIFLDIDERTAAERVYRDHQAGKRKSERALHSIDEVLQEMRERQESDRKRYKKYYNLVYDDHAKYDLVIDTTKMTADQVVDRILKAVKKKKA